MQLYIQTGKDIVSPVVVGAVTWQTERRGVPSKLTATVVIDKKLVVRNGSAVHFSVGKVQIFYGFVFKMTFDKENIMQITAYDQLRYLQAKETYVFEYATATDVVKRIAKDFRLQTGTLETTRYKKPSRIDENTKLFDIILSALDDELTNTKNIFVLYDNFGKLELRRIKTVSSTILIDAGNCQNAEVTASIDQDVYNQVKLLFSNEETGKRDIFIVKDSKTIKRWGLLQYFDTLKEGESGKAKADALLSLYDKERKSLRLTKVLGDWSIRAGALVTVKMTVGTESVSGVFLVEKCSHTLENGEHWMDLTVRNGNFND